jgi:cell division initiation protein
MRIAPIDITHRTFSKKMMGVDAQEVYDFLRDVADQMEELTRERQRLKEELVKKDQALAEYIERDQALRATIQAASKMSDQFRTDAEKEASLIISDARQRAEILMKDARDSLKKMYYEIADLKKARMQYETTLRSLMQAHITMLDQGKKIFPEPALGDKIDFIETETPSEISETMRPTVIGQA